MGTFIYKIATTFVLHILLVIALSLSFSGVMSLGINYGQVANNLPPPAKVLELLTSLKVTKTRIYDTSPGVLTAFANSNVEIIVTIENQMLPQLMDPQQALQWVTTHISHTTLRRGSRELQWGTKYSQTTIHLPSLPTSSQLWSAFTQL
jgi:hypothetical protein